MPAVLTNVQHHSIREEKRVQNPVLKLIARALVLLFPFAIFLVFFEFRFHALTPSLYGVKKERLERQASKIEVLVLGNSQPYGGVEPAVLGRPAFNLAAVSQTLYYDAALLGKYLPLLPSLKVVVIPVGYATLGGELDQSTEPWRCYYYRYFYSLAHRDWHKDLSVRNYSAYFLCNERVRLKVLLGTSENAATSFDDYGGVTWGFGTNWPPPAYPAANRSTDYLRLKAREALDRHTAWMKPQSISTNIGRLESMLQELKSRGIAVMLITLPTTPYYREGMPPETRQLVHDTINNLGGKFGATYHDYSADERFNDPDFSDGDHLGCSGAHKFSLILARDLAALNLTGSSGVTSGVSTNAASPSKAR